MGKKNKDQEPTANLSSVANRDVIQRINFLYQASTYLNSISQTLPHNSVNDAFRQQTVKRKSSSQKKRKSAVRHPRDIGELSRSYVSTMRIVGQKTMVRMDPALKRTLCKGCDTVLLPGSTASVRVHPLPSHGQAMHYTCLTCDTTRRIPAPPYVDPDHTHYAAQQPTGPSTAAATSDGQQASAMDIQMFETAIASPQQSRVPIARKKAVPRVPPLFERKGHVVFRGNERLRDEDPPV
ncbi:Rpr2-domain-containing protein [Trametes coccinea BRFM310]|uniref:Rpr2-domain-containing protein n=1 Tax=Trametes coccinea (strain BRFM310) TaxID=1353009 RepID=A0A1Y2J244_TRAC3|nr:Rpr2-domain-containing protein [Trametes coccinea BRFM310]